MSLGALEKKVDLQKISAISKVTYVVLFFYIAMDTSHAAFIAPNIVDLIGKKLI